MSSLCRRLATFWIVWTALLLVHEGGHAWAARRSGDHVRTVTVGVGPVLWRSTPSSDTRLVVRLVPLAGLTRVDAPQQNGWVGLGHELGLLGGGTLATAAVVLLTTGLVAAREGSTRRRCLWGRIVIADAVVLTVFNFLPIPPLDGGRAALAVLAAVRDGPFSSDALFWLHLGGLALAIVPMMVWTRWTGRIDRVAMRWRAPQEGSRQP